MAQAIVVKYLPPTDTKGVRLKAYCAAGQLTRGRQYELNPAEDAKRLAKLLVIQLKWSGADELEGGQLPDGNYVFVFRGTM